MTLLISDANVLIDFVDGDLIVQLFRLDAVLAVPDVLLEEELRGRHPELADLGLVSMELNATTIQRVVALAARHTRPSRNDLLALALAEQEQRPLLSGDKDLRRAAVREGVPVHGTIWVVGRLVEADIIDGTTARDAYARMRAAGSRLPWGEVDDQLRSFGVTPLGEDRG